MVGSGLATSSDLVQYRLPKLKGILYFVYLDQWQNTYPMWSLGAAIVIVNLYWKRTQLSPDHWQIDHNNLRVPFVLRCSQEKFEDQNPAGLRVFPQNISG